MPGKLSTRMLDAEPAPATGRKFLGDSEVRGFCGIVYAATARNRSGIRVLGFRYTNKDGVRKLCTMPPIDTGMAATLKDISI